jgi:hypothetical protein
LYIYEAPDPATVAPGALRGGTPRAGAPHPPAVPRSVTAPETIREGARRRGLSALGEQQERGIQTYRTEVRQRFEELRAQGHAISAERVPEAVTNEYLDQLVGHMRAVARARGEAPIDQRLEDAMRSVAAELRDPDRVADLAAEVRRRERQIQAADERQFGTTPGTANDEALGHARRIEALAQISEDLGLGDVRFLENKLFDQGDPAEFIRQLREANGPLMDTYFSANVHSELTHAFDMILAARGLERSGSSMTLREFVQALGQSYAAHEGWVGLFDFMPGGHAVGRLNQPEMRGPILFGTAPTRLPPGWHAPGRRGPN